MFKKDINYKTAVAIAVVFIILRIVLARSQMIFILPFSAPIDDDLYFRMANSIVRGEWLGRYDYLTLSKYPLFAVYLACLHLLGLPYTVGNCLVWIVVCGVCLWAFVPVIKTNISKLAFFLFMLYNPYSFNETNLRIYRDSLFFPLCILFFVGMAGWALRLKKEAKCSMVFMLFAGIGMAGSWISREDGYWLIPFYIVAVAICFVYIFTDKDTKQKTVKALAVLIPPVITAAAVITICFINYSYYGIFALTDFNGGSFSRFFGAMTTLPHEDWRPMVSVPEDVREQIYINCPSIQTFEYYLEDESSAIKKSYFHQETGDYKSGALYWAIRRRANETGVYESRTKAEAFWNNAAEEVEKYVRTVPDALPLRSSLTPPIKTEYIPDVLSVGAETILNIIIWKDIIPYQLALSDVTTGQIEIWESFLHNKSNYSAVENSYLPYHTPFQSLCYKIMEWIILLYRMITIVLLPVSAVATISGFINFKKYNREKQLLLFILLGLAGMFVFRRFMITYMEVSAFGIGFYSMYVAVCYPIMTLIMALAPPYIKR